MTGSPGKALLVVQSDIEAAQEDAFNTWYDDVHIPDVLALDHWFSCRRYRLAGDPRYFPPAAERPQEVLRYLAVWELDTDDVGEAEHSLAAGLVPLRAAGRVDMADEMRGRVSGYYLPLGPAQHSSRPG